MKAGPRFEKRVCDYFCEKGLPCERRVPGGSRDRGDVAGIRGWTLELKNTGAITLGPAMNEAQKEARNAHDDHFAAIHNRRNHDLVRSYVTIELWEFARLLRIEHEHNRRLGLHRVGERSHDQAAQALVQ